MFPMVIMIGKRYSNIIDFYLFIYFFSFFIFFFLNHFFSLKSVEGAAALRVATHNLIKGHTRLPYTSTAFDAWDMVTAADKGDAASTVVCVYTNKTFATSQFYSSTNPSGYSREHTWPKSLGFPDDGACNAPYTDGHHLFAAEQATNAARGNKQYGACLSQCTQYPIVGGVDRNVAGRYTWETWLGKRGDVARAQFYMDVRYEGGAHDDPACGAEIDLRLTNDDTLIRGVQSNAAVAYHGMLNDLLQWHADGN